MFDGGGDDARRSDSLVYTRFFGVKMGKMGNLRMSQGHRLVATRAQDGRIGRRARKKDLQDDGKGDTLCW